MDSSLLGVGVAFGPFTIENVHVHVLGGEEATYSLWEMDRIHWYVL